ncbi:MAG: prevent-host-death protein, partial [Nitrospirae bacterium]|nr:prevent-host-death protein [Nitrospirota bacterium]
IITKNGESCAALIDADRLDHYHRLEREHVHLTLLEEAVRGMENVAAGKTLSLKELKARYGR